MEIKDGAQFKPRNGKDVKVLVPNSMRLCIDPRRRTLKILHVVSCHVFLFDKTLANASGEPLNWTIGHRLSRYMSTFSFPRPAPLRRVALSDDKLKDFSKKEYQTML